MLDKHGRNINYLRVSLTDRCNLRCIYCMPKEGIPKKNHDKILRFEETIKIIRAVSTLGINKIRFTGGEPLIIQGIDKIIHETGKLENITDISLTTNGILLESMAADLKRGGLTRVNISLDTLKEDKYKMITRGGDIKKVTGAIEKCLSLGMTPIKLNIVLMKGINDDEIDDFIKLTKEMPIHVRFIELMPIGEGVKYYENSFMSAKEVIESHPELIPMDRPKSGTAELFKIKDAKGIVGFINPLSCKFCSDCNRIRLTAQGGIKPCLHSSEEINIKKYLDNEVLLHSALKDIIYNKPSEHHMEEDGHSESQKMMYQIGG